MAIYTLHHKHLDFAIHLTIYNRLQGTTRRTFYLRNLAGESETERVEQATQIMNEVAAEVHYLTGFGVDKGTITIAGKKATEVVYPDLEPRPLGRSFLNRALFRFRKANYYIWVEGSSGSRANQESHQDNDGQMELMTRSQTVSFRLPCTLILETRRKVYKLGEADFFGRYPPGRRERKNSSYSLYYDKNDALFQSFINRFYENGKLCFGDWRYFIPDGTPVEIIGGPWPKSKAKRKKGPRKTVLASQPTDSTDYVYLIRMGRTKSYKIGKSNDPQGRLANLQSANPYKLMLVHTFSADNASGAEESLHAALHENRMGGEWFKLSDEQRKALASVSEYKNGHFVVGKKAFSAETLVNT